MPPQWLALSFPTMTADRMPRRTRTSSEAGAHAAVTSDEESRALAAAVAAVADNAAALRSAVVPADTEPPTIFTP